MALVCLVLPSKAQTGFCPPNLDFEQGDFGNWVCRTGNVSIVGGQNTITWTGTGAVPGRHTIISAATAGTDFYGGFPQKCPNGSQYSVMLGNTQTQAQAEGVFYTYTIPAGINVFSIFFWYAVVLQNPGHTAEQQPRFRARIFNVTDNTSIGCVTFDFTASSSLPGFRVSLVNPQVIYKDWTPVTLNLTGLAGKTIQLEFITSDCTLGGHFGYAYLDVNSTCNGAIEGTYLCPGATTATLTAPYGFQFYEWYSDPSFTQVISTNQVLTLNPPPSVGTVFPVIVTPYPSFGCVDTLYATISIAPPPVADAGPDVDVCKNQLVQIGSPPLQGYTYLWSPASQVSNPAVANPMAWLPAYIPTDFIVKATDILTGCSAYDTVLVSIKAIDTALTITGKTTYCVGESLAATLAVNNVSSAVQWYEGNNPIAGATSFSYRPSNTGTYWAQITQDGCIDSTAKIVVSINPLPQASFYPDKDTSCVTKNSFLFTNTSTVSDNSAMTYVWKFSDGSTDQTTDASKSFAAVGTYTAKLVATSAFGCKDSTQKNVRVMPNAIPDFIWDSICTNRPMHFSNLSIENASPQVNYTWDFQNGGAGSPLKNPLPVTYITPGKADVTLSAVALGCENDPRTITKTVQVNKSVPGIRYPDITVPLGSSHYIHVRGDVGKIYDWKPKIQLSRYNDQYTEFIASSDDVKYLIDITDQHTCVTTDTMQMLVLKKPGYYLPTAFTPNGDGLNDVVKPYLIGMKSLKSFSIYNRWGNRLFYSEKYGEGWDGKYNGADQGPGVYVWILVFVDNNDKTITEKGTITLIR